MKNFFIIAILFVPSLLSSAEMGPEIPGPFSIPVLTLGRLAFYLIPQAR